MFDPLSAAQALLVRHWSLSARLERLPGENANFRASSGSGEVWVFKVATDPEGAISLEEDVSARLLDAGIPVPACIPAPDGAPFVVTEFGGKVAWARLQHFLPGRPWRELGSSPARLEAIGHTVAQVHRALEGFAENHPLARRTHRWDLAEAHRWRPETAGFESPNHRRAAERSFHLFAATARPLLPGCPRGMLHGDINDENVLMDGDRVVGLVDLGDTQAGALVQDLAIALAYALQHEGVGLNEGAHLVAGYAALRPLQPLEARVLFPLVLARLATSAAIAAHRRSRDPDHSTWFSHERSTLEALHRFAHLAPREAQEILVPTSGRPPAPPVEELQAHRRRALGPSLSLSYERPLHITEGRGAHLIAADGRPYLDLVNNVCHVGHAHPRVARAIAEQAATLNTNTRYLHGHVVRYAQRLTATLPDSLDTCFFVNSGSEANELALRLARAATGARDVLVLDGAYHGNTGNCVAMSPYKFDGPGGQGAPEWVHVAPVPDGYRGLVRGAPQEVGVEYAERFGRVLDRMGSEGRSPAAFFAEPILSCGGQLPLPPGYLEPAYARVRAAGGLCVADEVQVGFGRVGDHFWAFEEHGVVPDIVVLGKPMGNGHPMGAVVTTRGVADAFDDGMEFFSTFGGNPVSCAAGLAVLDVIEDEGLQGRALELGCHFLDGLCKLQTRHSLVGDVRGRGLFLGVELVRDRHTLEPADTEATAIVNAMREQGVLLSTDGPLHNVLKIKPPLVLERDDIDYFLWLLDAVLEGLD